MIRPFHLRDLPLVIRLSERGVVLEAEAALTSSPNPVRSALVNMIMGGEYATYVWQDNTTNSTFNITHQGIYWVKVTTNNCSTTDSIIVYYNQLPKANLGNDTTICQGETLTLDVSAKDATYLWQDNSTNSSFIVKQPGLYWVKVTINNCSNTDSIIVGYYSLPIIFSSYDTQVY